VRSHKKEEELGEKNEVGTMYLQATFFEPWVLFRSNFILDLNTVALLFVFNNYCLTMD
jgi:hypothetical protein